MGSPESRCQFLSEGVGAFVLNWDVVFLEDSPAFFRNSSQIWDRNAATFSSQALLPELMKPLCLLAYKDLTLDNYYLDE